MVMILVSSDIKEAVLHALYKAVGLNTPGHGIAFAVPVDNVVGLTDKKLKESVGEEKPSKEKSLVETAPKDDEPQAESVARIGHGGQERKDFPDRMHSVFWLCFE